MTTIVRRRGPHVPGHENATLQVYEYYYDCCRIVLCFPPRSVPNNCRYWASFWCRCCQCWRQLIFPTLVNVSTWQWCFAYKWSWVSGFGCWILGRCSSESCNLEWTSSISYDVCCRASTFWGLVFLDSASSCHGCLSHWQPTVSRDSYVQLVWYTCPFRMPGITMNLDAQLGMAPPILHPLYPWLSRVQSTIFNFIFLFLPILSLCPPHFSHFLGSVALCHLSDL